MSNRQPSPVLRFIRKIADTAACRNLADASLLERFVDARDAEAFGLLMERHGPIVLGVCRRILGTDEVEDAFQATFLVLVCKAGSLSRRDLLGPWLYGVAVRTALKARMKIWKRRSLERPLTDMARAPREENDRDLRRVLDEELQRLPPRLQRPLFLCYLEGRTTAEASRILDCPHGTVLSRLSRAREKLRKRLSRRGVALSAAGLAMHISSDSVIAMPAGLYEATARAAGLFSLGKACGAGAVSAPVVILTKGVLTSMLMTKLKMTTAILTLLAGTVAGVWAFRGEPGELADARKSVPGTGARRTVALAASAPADEQSILRALLDKGIKAAGGKAKLGNFKAGTCKIKGVVHDAGRTDSFALEVFLQGSDQFKMDGEVEGQDMKEKVIVTLNGDQAWDSFGGKVRDVAAPDLHGCRNIIRAFRYVHVLTPLKDKGVTLAPLGEIDIAGKPAVGLKVACNGQDDIHVFLNKETGLPVKAEFKITYPQGQEEALEFAFSDYKEFNGRKHFTRVEGKQNGKALFEAELSDFRWLDRLDASIFARPKTVDGSQ